MTGYAESHVEPLDLIDLIHICYIPMARLAFETALNMPLMSKVDIPGHRIYLVPRNRLLLRPIIPDFTYFIHDIYSRPVEIVFDIAPRYVRVAPHAFFNRRYSGVRRYVYETVTVLTGELSVVHAGMDFMTEPYRLNRTLAAALSAEVEKI
jgi:hypothetical protein